MINIQSKWTFLILIGICLTNLALIDAEKSWSVNLSWTLSEGKLGLKQLSKFQLLYISQLYSALFIKILPSSAQAPV